MGVGGTGVRVAGALVGVAVEVVAVGSAVDVSVGVNVGNAVEVSVGVAVGRGVRVGVDVSVSVGVAIGVGVTVEVLSGSSVFVTRWAMVVVAGVAVGMVTGVSQGRRKKNPLKQATKITAMPTNMGKPRRRRRGTSGVWASGASAPSF